MSNVSTQAHFPDNSAVALLLIDVINELDFEGGQALLEQALPMTERIAALKRAAKQAGVPVVYANDNFGRWRSDFRQAVRRCLEDRCRGRPLVERLQPEDDDYFVLKPKFSAFFGTTLEVLLGHLGVESLILTGISADICVLFTANDAHMRGYRLFVPADCTACADPSENRHVLQYMERVFKVDTRPSAALSALLPDLKAGAD